MSDLIKQIVATMDANSTSNVFTQTLPTEPVATNDVPEESKDTETE